MQAQTDSLKNTFSKINALQELNTSIIGYELHQYVCGQKETDRKEFIPVLIGALPALARENPSFASLAARTLLQHAADYHHEIVPVALQITPGMAEKNIDMARVMYRALLCHTPNQYARQIKAEAKKYAHHFPHNTDYQDLLKRRIPQ